MYYIFDTIFKSDPSLQLVKWAIVLESCLVQHYISSRWIVIEILYDYLNWLTQLEGEIAHYISIVFGPTKFHAEEVYFW